MRTPNNERVGSDIAKSPSRKREGSRKGTPERRCILTGEHASRAALIRLAVSPEGLVLPDVHARAPGRGAWIGVTRAELETAHAKGKLKAALARAFKSGALTIPADLPARVEDALRKALAERLGLELRAGSILLGTQRIAEGARGGAVAQLYHASDSSEDGRKKLDQAWRVGQAREGSGERGILLPLDRAALSVALGRDNVVHLAVVDDRAAERVNLPLQRLLHFLGAQAGPADTNSGSERPARASGDDEI
jgi:uncharacterized protein